MRSLFLKHASEFLQDKCKATKFAFAGDVSNAEVWTRQVTDCNPWVPDARVMAQIAKASYNLNDYWRIVDVLHKRLHKIDWKKWRIAYNSLVLLDFLLTYGPEDFATEFQCDRAIIQELAAFEYKDAKGFDWGFYMKHKSERVLELLERGVAFHEARSKAINLTSKIQGFGSHSFSSLSSSSTSKWIPLSLCWLRCSSTHTQKDYRTTHTSEDLSDLLIQSNNYNYSIEKDDTEATLFDLMGLMDDEEEEVAGELCLEIHVNHVGYSE